MLKKEKVAVNEFDMISISINRLLKIELQIHSCLKNPEKFRETLDILYDMKASEKNYLKSIRNGN